MFVAWMEMLRIWPMKVIWVGELVGFGLVVMGYW